jgi:hypothetical protein
VGGSGKQHTVLVPNTAMPFTRKTTFEHEQLTMVVVPQQAIIALHVFTYGGAYTELLPVLCSTLSPAASQRCAMVVRVTAGLCWRDFFSLFML